MPVGAGSVRLLVGSVEMDVRVPVSLMLVDVRVDAHAECTAKGPQTDQDENRTHDLLAHSGEPLQR